MEYERKSFRPNFIIQTIELIWSIWEKPIRPIRYQSTIVPPTTAKVTTWPFFINLEMRFFKCQIIIDLEWPMDYYIDYLKRLRIGSLVNSFISTEKLTLWLKYIYDQTDLWITIRPRETGRQRRDKSCQLPVDLPQHSAGILYWVSPFHRLARRNCLSLLNPASLREAGDSIIISVTF